MRNLICVVILLMMLTTPINGDRKFVKKICKTTENYELCMEYVWADPRAPEADTRTLAIIMIDTVKAKSKVTDKLIKRLLKSHPDLKVPLEQCAWDYEVVILKTLIKVAYDGVILGDPKFAEEAMTKLPFTTIGCENHFAGHKSPLTHLNKLVGELADVTRDVIRNLL
ncbi:PREDICTED: uncharacterized protein LOC109169939 [Ipomoea nil]|uniref:uncharacterized protein LOC109169939 n=1 Tax=Ipomoea nil TaxID=35883 RepID=UPI000900CAA6|nr:PREDICTED: uncharacterized protein LOC109169939 [Ipomoea nil]